MQRTGVILVASAVLVVAVIAVVLAQPSVPYPRLVEKLLSPSDVPSTWQAQSFQQVTRGTGCLATIMRPKGFQQTGQANVVYINSGSVPPEVGEAIATFRDTAGAFAKIISSLQSCKFINGGNPNLTGIYGTVSSFSTPGYGDLSKAFEASVTAPAVPVTLTDDIVVIKKNHYILEIFETNLGKVNMQQFEGFIAKALTKI